MITDFHFIRPFWLLAILPLVLLGFGLMRQRSVIQAWQAICDAHLLAPLLQMQGHSKRAFSICVLLGSGLCMILGLAGPTWSRLPVPIYQQVQPRVVLLDMSDTMLAKDLPPDRLTRAKFKLHDLLQQHEIGQVGLIAYTSEPFVVSPLTDDGQTIDALLPMLTPNVMPVQGNQLEKAITEAQKLITATGAQSGEILVLTAQLPSDVAVSAARVAANQGFHVSIIPMLEDKSAAPLFEPLAKAGLGDVISFTNDQHDLKAWLANTHTKATYQTNEMDDIPVWRDEGRWFLIPALLLLLPVFWRGWLQRINT